MSFTLLSLTRTKISPSTVSIQLKGKAASAHAVDSEEKKNALKPRLYREGMLEALENHNCGVLVLPPDLDHPTDLAGYPSIHNLSRLRTCRHLCRIRDASSSPCPNVSQVSHGICIGCCKTNVSEPATVFRSLPVSVTRRDSFESPTHMSKSARHVIKLP